MRKLITACTRKSKRSARMLVNVRKDHSLPLSTTPPSDYSRACSNEIVEHTSDNETVRGSSRKLEGAAEHLIDGNENRLCRLIILESACY